MVALALLPLGSAKAHDERNATTVVLDEIVPPLPGVVIQAVSSVTAQLVVENPTPTPLEVLGVDGSPYLRIGPAGVEANLRSADWYRSNDPVGATPLPAAADGGAPPRWVLVSREPAWGWFDHRLHAAADDRPGPWAVPMRYGATVVTVRGRRTAIDTAGRFATRVHPPPDGVGVIVVDGRVPALILTATGPQVVTVIGEEGEPMARAGPAGAEVNLASPTWSLTAAARHGRIPDGIIDAGAPPRWEHFNRAPQLTWLDRRLAGRPMTTHDWAVPILIGARESELTGTTAWLPDIRPAVAVADPAGPPRAGLARLGGLIAALGLVLGLVLRRRRSAAMLSSGRGSPA